MLLLFLSIAVATAAPTVKTKCGVVEGFVFTTKANKTVEAFLGIPFAKPPVGELRFEKPQPPLPFKRGFFVATKFGPTCYPHVNSSIAGPVSEDCLQLNIIRPPNAKKTSRLPVLVWIHGGGFETGSALMHGYEGFGNYTTHDVIVVTIQYRLGFLGFFSTGTKEMPGNLGLWDQRAALKWLKENIVQFGGDPDRIIAWGLSAGGASASALTLSPHSRDLVHSSIEHSGSAFVGFANGYEVSEHSMTMAKLLGCHRHTKECLKKKTVDEMMAAVEKMGKAADSVATVFFGSRIDGDFLPSSPHKLVKETRPKPTLISMASKEGTTFTTFGALPDIHKFTVNLNNSNDWDREMFKQRIQKQLVNEKNFGRNTKRALKDIMKFYIDDVDCKRKNPTFFIDQYTNFISDVVLNIGGLEGADAKRKAGWPVYMYKLNHANDVIFPKGFPERFKGAPHAGDWAYLCETFAFDTFDLYSKDERPVTESQQLNIVHFAKTGKPRFVDVGQKKKMRYLDITTRPELRTDPFPGVLKFWRGMRKYGFDPVSLTPIDRKRSSSRESSSSEEEY